MVRRRYREPDLSRRPAGEPDAGRTRAAGADECGRASLRPSGVPPDGANPPVGDDWRFRISGAADGGHAHPTKLMTRNQRYLIGGIVGLLIGLFWPTTLTCARDPRRLLVTCDRCGTVGTLKLAWSGRVQFDVDNGRLATVTSSLLGCRELGHRWVVSHWGRERFAAEREVLLRVNLMEETVDLVDALIELGWREDAAELSKEIIRCRKAEIAAIASLPPPAELGDMHAPNGQLADWWAENRERILDEVACACATDGS